MGGNQTKVIEESLFDEEELECLKKVFNEKKEKNKSDLDLQSFLKLFPNTNTIGKRLFSWTTKLLGRKTIDFKNLISLCELLVKMNCKNEKFKKYLDLDSLDLFTLISLEKTETIEIIAYSEAITMILFLFEILLCNEKDLNIDENEKMAETILYELDWDNEKKIKYSRFAYHLKEQFLYINKSIKFYFASHLTNPNLKQRTCLPQLNEPSEILKRQHIAFLSLGNSIFSYITDLTLLYSTKKSGTSFNRIAFEILGYSGSTLLVLTHIENNKKYIIGGYNYNYWKDQLDYFGTSESYILSLEPKFHQFFTYKGQGETNYCYFNSKEIDRSKYKKGLGFGGKNFDNYRLWIDDDIETNCSVSHEDKTYENGPLIEYSTNKLNIESLEIWGLGGETALKDRFDYRMSQQEKLEKMRKVDKAAFLNSFDTEFLLGKTFAHKNQVQIDVEKEKEMDKEKEKE